jgi:hypothetical protein
LELVLLAYFLLGLTVVIDEEGILALGVNLLSNSAILSFEIFLGGDILLSKAVILEGEILPTSGLISIA